MEHNNYNNLKIICAFFMQDNVIDSPYGPSTAALSIYLFARLLLHFAGWCNENTQYP